MQRITWRGLSTDFQSAFCAILSSLALCPVNYNCLGFPRISAPSSQLKGLQSSSRVLFPSTNIRKFSEKSKGHAHLWLLCLSDEWTLIIMKCPSFSLVIFFALKSIFSDINIASPAFVSYRLLGIFFSSINFQPIYALYLNCVSCRYYIVGSLFI